MRATVLTLMVSMAMLGCAEPETGDAIARVDAGRWTIELDERPVLLGDVVEVIDAGAYVYLRLSIVRDSARPQQLAHTSRRWVAVDGETAGLGDRIRVRSLGRRRGVWDPVIERDFPVLEYVAVIGP